MRATSARGSRALLGAGAPSGEQLDSGDERKLNALVRFGLCFGAGFRELRGDQKSVRAGAELFHGVDLGRGPAACQLGQADVCRDPVEPGTEWRTRLKPIDSPPRAEQRLLQRVVGVVDLTEQPVAMQVMATAMRSDQSAKSDPVPQSRRPEPTLAPGARRGNLETLTTITLSAIRAGCRSSRSRVTPISCTSR